MIPQQLPLPASWAVADGLIDRLERRLAVFHLAGLDLWTCALRRAHRLLRARECAAYEQLMLLEHEVEVSADKREMMATIARAKGLLAGLMLGLLALQVFSGTENMIARTARRGGRRRDEVVEVVS